MSCKVVYLLTTTTTRLSALRISENFYQNLLKKKKIPSRLLQRQFQFLVDLVHSVIANIYVPPRFTTPLCQKSDRVPRARLK